MSFTNADLDKLDRAIAQGVLQVQDRDGKTVRYRSMDEMMRARHLMAKQLGTIRGGSRKTPAFSKGL